MSQAEDLARDAADVARARSGDPGGFEALVARYARRVHDLARRILRDAHEAEDATQHAFLKAWQALDRYDPGRPFRHWLLRITTNLCRNRLRARAVRRHELRPRGGEDPLPEPAAPAPAPPCEAADPRLAAAVAALPEPYRTALLLRYQHDLSLEEIAEITATPVATVKTHLHRGRRALARALGGETPGAAAGTEGGA